MKYVARICKSKSLRYQNNEAVVYGEHLLLEALKYNILNAIFIKDDKLSKYSYILKDFPSENIYLIDEKCLSKMGGSDSPIDIVGLVKIKSQDLGEQVYNDDCVILEAIQDPGNLGTIFRSLAAVGINNVILDKNCVDPYNIKVIRASQGVQFNLNIIMDVNLQDFLDNYNKKVWATDIIGGSNIYECKLNEKCAWVFGNEGSGLSKSLLKHNKVHKVSIPMLPNINSLNVAMATTLCVFEMLRQRYYL